MRWTLDTTEQDAKSGDTMRRIRELGERLTTGKVATPPVDKERADEPEVPPTSEEASTPEVPPTSEEASTPEVPPTSEEASTPEVPPTSEEASMPIDIVRTYWTMNALVYALALVVILGAANAILSTKVQVVSQSAKPTPAPKSLTYVVAYDDPQHTRPLATFTPVRNRNIYMLQLLSLGRTLSMTVLTH